MNKMVQCDSTEGKGGKSSSEGGGAVCPYYEPPIPDGFLGTGTTTGGISLGPLFSLVRNSYWGSRS